MIWLKNVWYVAGFAHELAQQPFVARTFLGQPVVMFQTADGTVSALHDVCPHRLMPLSKGRRVGDELQCGYHGMKFNTQGACTDIPGQTQIPAKACTQIYPLVARHGLLWIWLGQADLADEALIPDVHWNDDPHWTPSIGYHHIDCDFRLVNDNLLDLSHESYVHLRTIGNEEEESIANYPLQVTIEGDRLIRAHRDMPNIDPPPFFAMILQHEGPINRWQTAINLIPGINMTDVGVYPIEKTKPEAHMMHVMHLLTPETEKSTHYFWTIVRNFDLGNPDLTDRIQKAIAATFDEDKIVLEIQQKQLDTLGHAVPNVAIRLDEAAIRARRLLDQQVRRELADNRSVIRPLPLVEEIVAIESAQ